jgi:hypothetical protein
MDFRCICKKGKQRGKYIICNVLNHTAATNTNRRNKGIGTRDNAGTQNAEGLWWTLWWEEGQYETLCWSTNQHVTLKHQLHACHVKALE